jgi:hypothetical protein
MGLVRDLILEQLSETTKNTKKVFLGGTAANSTWREELIPMLEINYFNPVVDDWNKEAQNRELKERKLCDYCLYVITPEMEGVYSIAEVIDDSNKRPDKTVFCYMTKTKNKNEFSKHQVKSLEQVGKMVDDNGGTWLKTLKEVADFLNEK